MYYIYIYITSHVFISPIAVVFISPSERVTCVFVLSALLEDFYVSRALQPIFEQQEKRMGYPPPWRFLGAMILPAS